MFVIENRPASLSAPLWHTASWLEALKSHLYWENVEDSPPWLAGELASYKFHKHIYQLLSHLETKPPLVLSNRAVGRVLLSHCLFPYLLCYGGIKQKQWVKGGTLHYWPPDCGHWALSLRWALSLLSAECSLPAPAERPSSPLSPPSSLKPWRSSAERPRGPLGNTYQRERRLRYFAQI